MSNELIGIISDENFNVKVQITESGPRGLQGNPGKDGYTPVKGIDYFDGEQGSKGDKGEQGPKGEKGIKGDTGEQGLQGLKGDKGDKGERGIKGDTGADGYTPIKGIDYFDGVKGDKGDKGEQGIQGTQGPKGEQGIKGDTGERGLQGVQGLKGDKGDKGEQGIQGVKGDIGEVSLAQLNVVQNELTAHKEDYTNQRQQDQLKVATVEKGLNDYKSTMANVNVNQEAKQEVTGYGIISLPKNTANGQVSASVKGNTLTNKLGATVESSCTTSSANSRITIGNLGQISPNINTKTYQFIQGHKYFVKYKLKNSSIGRLYDYIRVQVSTALTVKGTSTGSVLESYALWTATENYPNGYFYAVSGDPTGQLDLDYAFVYDLTEIFGADKEPTEEQANQILGYVSNTKSTISASRLKSVDKDGIQESISYLPNVGELRSLPDGVRDEIKVSGGKAESVQRTKKYVLNGRESWAYPNDELTNTEKFSVEIMDKSKVVANAISLDKFPVLPHTYADIEGANSVLNFLGLRVLKSSLVGYSEGLTSAQKLTLFKTWLAANPLTLTYQLAEPIITPIQVSGTLLSNPSGTIYVENVVADAGLYNNGITTQYTDLPIKTVDKLIKYDFETGVQTSLDVSEVVVNANKLSFTHPNLVNGDMVFYDYFYDVESTEGETEIEYYDSRHTIKDTTNNKFYSWKITSTNGVPTVNLTEVL